MQQIPPVYGYGMVVSERIRAQIDEYYEGIRLRPSMYGTPSEIEAMWWVLLGFEALLLEPIPDEARVNDTRFMAIRITAGRHGWSGNAPLHAHVRGSASLIPILNEVRTEFLRHLTDQSACSSVTP